MVTHWDAARVGEYALWVSDDNKTWTEVIPKKTLDNAGPVSYTHLDVYTRQR